MNRRDILKAGAAGLALGFANFPLGWTAAADDKKKNLLMFTRSQGYEHGCIKRGKENALSLGERIVTDLAKKHGFEVTCTKDGRQFLSENIAKYDAFLFETTGDLTKDGGDGNPPMPEEGKKAFLQAIADGKGFVGCHCASDTFHTSGKRDETQPLDKRDPYTAMIGGEFIVHGSQQKSRIDVVDESFPGAKPFGRSFEILDEWYALKNFQDDLHVIFVQNTEKMEKTQGANKSYDRPNFPETWARMHGKGRVFFTSMGHREDVWENPMYLTLLLGALGWTTGRLDASIEPNLRQVAPKYDELPK